MNQIVNLQIPVETDLRNRALAGAKSLGFSNLQESIRLFLHQLASDNFEIILSAKNDRRYNKMIDDIESGKEKTLKFDNTRDMFKYLNDPNRTSP